MWFYAWQDSAINFVDCLGFSVFYVKQKKTRHQAGLSLYIPVFDQSASWKAVFTAL